MTTEDLKLPEFQTVSDRIEHAKEEAKFCFMVEHLLRSEKPVFDGKWGYFPFY